jgi:hypothetical protein
MPLFDIYASFFKRNITVMWLFIVIKSLVVIFAQFSVVLFESLKLRAFSNFYFTMFIDEKLIIFGVFMPKCEKNYAF